MSRAVRLDRVMSRHVVVNAVRVLRLVVLGWMPACPCAAAEAPTTPAPGSHSETSRRQAEALCSGKTPSELIPLLGDERFPIRQCAEDKLHQLLHEAPADPPNAVETLCFETYQTHSDPEIRMRARAVLMDFATTLWSPECFLGVAVEAAPNFDDDGNLNSHLKITKVMAKSPAAIVNIETGDFLRGIDAIQFTDANAAKQLTTHLVTKRPGDQVTLHLEHAGKQSDVTVRLGCKPRTQHRDKDDKPMTVTPAQCLREYLAFKQR